MPPSYSRTFPMRANQGPDIDDDRFEAALAALDREHLRRRPRLIESECAATVTIEGRSLILMASNDYLGLASHSALKAAAIEATQQYGVGAGASRLISGTLPPHRALERELARVKASEAALLFGSGYLANIGVLPALVGAGDLILADRLCHASLIDGCRLSRATLRVFRHGDVEQVERLLTRRPAKRRVLIVTEGIFSMDGDAAPLPELVKLAQTHGARLFLDDAHGTGVMGAQGGGTAEHFGIKAASILHMGTLGKALGTSGAYVTGSQSLIDYLVNTARSFIYSTAPPPATAAAAVVALRILESEPERRTRLWANRAYLYEGLDAMGLSMTKTVSPIIPVLIGDTGRAISTARLLYEQGIFAPAIRPPTVPKGKSRIRLTVTSDHSQHQLDQVLSAFQLAGQQLGLVG